MDRDNSYMPHMHSPELQPSPVSHRRSPSSLPTLSALFIVLGVVCSVPTVSAQSGYTITDLGTLAGTESAVSEAFGINASGQITGVSDTSNERFHAFLYDPILGMVDIGTLTGPDGYSVGKSINSSGQVTGGSPTVDDVNGRAFLYAGGAMTDLGTLGGSGSIGYGINSSGQVTGSSYVSDVPNKRYEHAFLYSGGTMTDLGTLGGRASVALAINDAGQITGFASTAGDRATHAFLYQGRRMIDIGTLGGASEGFGINNSGQITGFSEPSPSVRHAFLYSGGSMIDLGTVGTDTWSWGYSINASGQVVGLSGTPNVDSKAFLWTSAGGMVDLNSLIPSGSGWQLNTAFGINDAGQITGRGFYNGARHAFLLTPPPSADLAITKSAAARVAAGQPLTYSITVRNNGPSDANGVTVSDPLPNDTTFASDTSSSNCTDNGTGIVTCDLATLAAGAQAAVSITINVPASARGTTISNTATVGNTDPPDPNPGNDTATAKTRVTR